MKSVAAPSGKCQRGRGGGEPCLGPVRVSSWLSPVRTAISERGRVSVCAGYEGKATHINFGDPQRPPHPARPPDVAFPSFSRRRTDASPSRPRGPRRAPARRHSPRRAERRRRARLRVVAEVRPRTEGEEEVHQRDEDDDEGDQEVGDGEEEHCPGRTSRTQALAGRARQRPRRRPVAGEGAGAAAGVHPAGEADRRLLRQPALEAHGRARRVSRPTRCSRSSTGRSRVEQGRPVPRPSSRRCTSSPSSPRASRARTASGACGWPTARSRRCTAGRSSGTRSLFLDVQVGKSTLAAGACRRS